MMNMMIDDTDFEIYKITSFTDLDYLFKTNFPLLIVLKLTHMYYYARAHKCIITRITAVFLYKMCALTSQVGNTSRPFFLYKKIATL